ncbi:MAG TPA: hypothetical protein HA364_02415 [Thermoplasmata archaeon]|nr:hypothetical protein [Thermoplasmata archaeon]
MADGISGHPILAYLTFAMPAILLVLGLVFHASVFLIIMTILWLGIGFTVLYLPLASDDGSRT